MTQTGPKTARFYRSEGQRVRCTLCPFNCSLGVEQRGACGARVNHSGRLVTENYGVVTAMAVEPVEKKPLYHFHPGHLILSVGSFGCNLGCDFCQNWELSQRRAPGASLEPDGILDLLNQQGEECIGVAYTFSEPTVWYEFVVEAATLVHGAGRKNVIVTNGFINREPLETLVPFLDAANVDLKGFDQPFYARVCKGMVEPVKQTIIRLHDAGVHVEVTTLLIPGANDEESHLRSMYQWLACVDENIPMHISRYFPDYRRTTPATSGELLTGAARIASEYLRYVYIGNWAFSNASETRCARCGAVLVRRSGYTVRQPTPLKAGACSTCGTLAPFRGSVRERTL